MNDLDIAKDQAKHYNEYKEKCSVTDPVDFDIKILTTSYWPSFKSFELSVPNEINKCMENFQLFYKNH